MSRMAEVTSAIEPIESPIGADMPEGHCVGRVLLVGAYERDNFGDLLFLLLSEQYFRGHEVIGAAPFPSDMSELLGRFVPGYTELLTRERFDHIWAVGGEVGAVTPEAALRMSSTRDVWQEYSAASDSEKELMLTEAFGGPIPASPYIPRPTQYPLNACATLGLNSVGLSGIGRLGQNRQQHVLSTLRSARPIIVRDEASSRLLERHGISHRLEPDLVHSLAVTRPAREAARSDYVLVQVSESALKRFGPEAFASTLASVPLPPDVEVRLFLAGTANGHDSVEAYRGLVTHMSQIRPTLYVRISTAMDPMVRVDEISRARLWIGTSLHGRIVATAYGVPRVSLDVRKVNAYAATWDPRMPSGVTMADLPAAVETALTMAPAAELAEQGYELGVRADRSMREAVASTLGGECDMSPIDRFESLESLRAGDVARRDSEIAELRLRLARSAADSQELRTLMVNVTRDLSQLRKDVADSGLDAFLHRVESRLSRGARRASDAARRRRSKSR